MSWIKPIESQFIPKPDLTLWFDISIETSQKRLLERNKAQQIENCRLESEDIAFFNRVRSAYKEIAKNEPNRFITIDAEQEIPFIQKQVEEMVLTRIQGNR